MPLQFGQSNRNWMVRALRVPGKTVQRCRAGRKTGTRPRESAIPCHRGDPVRPARCLAV